jgi:hypothetical protein
MRNLHFQMKISKYRRKSEISDRNLIILAISQKSENLAQFQKTNLKYLSKLACSSAAGNLKLTTKI